MSEKLQAEVFDAFLQVSELKRKLNKLSLKDWICPWYMYNEQTQNWKYCTSCIIRIDSEILQFYLAKIYLINNKFIISRLNILEQSSKTQPIHFLIFFHRQLHLSCCSQFFLDLVRKYQISDYLTWVADRGTELVHIS